MKNKTFFLCAVVLIAGVLLQGCLTGSMRGFVMDQNDEPIHGAIVSTDPPTHSVRTTEDGFRLRGIPVGEYTVIAEKPGYRRTRISVQVQWNEITEADIQLHELED